jgi:hypothetical protein
MFPSEKAARYPLRSLVVSSALEFPLEKNMKAGTLMSASRKNMRMRNLRNWKYSVIPTPYVVNSEAREAFVNQCHPVFVSNTG